jgi:hypothetical protein
MPRYTFTLTQLRTNAITRMMLDPDYLCEERLILHIARQLANALLHLHQCGFAHRLVTSLLLCRCLLYLTFACYLELLAIVISPLIISCLIIHMVPLMNGLPLPLLHLSWSLLALVLAYFSFQELVISLNSFACFRRCI